METVRVLLSINPSTAPHARGKSVVGLEEQEPSQWSSPVLMEEAQWSLLCGSKTVSVTRTTSVHGTTQALILAKLLFFETL